MKTPFSSKTLIALAVAVAAAAGYKSLANEQPIPPPATESALPAGIPLGSPVGQVFKLAQAGVDPSVIQSYIQNSPTAFNLDADTIIALTDAGVSSEMVSAMFAHDKALPAPVAAAPAAPVAAPNQPAAPVATAEAPPPPTTAPPSDLDLNQVSQTLTPYGSWVEIDGYGRCWRPSVVVYDSTWRPYCDRGQWVYTDCGWYWNSDYAWGVTFHYGRWFNQPGYGWCWWPDRVWAPSWVTWRSDNSYCGWAPLPPYTAYQTGVGFTYHGGNVAVNFGFGLASSCFTFVTFGNFCEHHPRYYCASPQQVTQIFNNTTIINNYNYRNRTIVNNGVSVTVIGNGGHHPIQQVPVGTLVNGGNHGWHGQSMNLPGRHFGADAGDGSGNRQFAGTGSHGDTMIQNPYAAGSSNRHDQRDNGFTTRNDNNNSSQRTPTVAGTPDNRQDQRNWQSTAHDGNSTTHPVTTTTTTANPVATAPARNPSQNNWSNTARDNQQNTRPSSTITPAPSQPTRPSNWGANNIQPSPPRSDYREPPRQAYSQPAYTAPPAAVQRTQSSEPRQNYSQSSSRYVAPSVPTMPAPAQSQRQNQAQNGQAQNYNGRNQNWMVQNH